MSSKRRIRRKSCDGKVQYSSSAEGQVAIWSIKKNTGDQSLINVYKCQFCKKYHVGHAPGAAKKWSFGR